MINLWPLLLPAAAWSGWYVANRSNVEKQKKHANHLSQEYVVGLNYLLNEQSDKALDVFIKLLEIDSEMVETHLALGSLFRRRGEVDKAIRIHQNLIARPQLSASQRKEALIALGQDYMNSGVFDRAERIFLEVIESSNNKENNSLLGLLAIYQQEKAWEKALEVIKKVEPSIRSQFHHQEAHYYCEMADQALKANAFDRAKNLMKQALSSDPESVRSSLMTAHIAMKEGKFKQAIQALKKVPQQDVEFLTEIIEPLVVCYRQLQLMSECIEYLESMLTIHPRTSVIFAIAEYIHHTKDRDVALDFVTDNLSKHPSIKGLNRLIYWYLETAHGKVREKLYMLYEVTSKFLVNKPIYRCGHCGFGGKHLHWLCPSCKQWGKTKPIHGLEGD